MAKLDHVEPNDALHLFKSAYQNRYTWEPGFKGYQGNCSMKKSEKEVVGEFILSSDMKPKIKGIDDEGIKKAISSQLWEVAIHRVRRSFEDVHGSNTFSIGNTNDVGLEIIVGGSNKGDKYRIKDNIVTMVYRNIHGSLINIFTTKTIDTGDGYLSNLYTSQYLDPVNGMPIKGKSNFVDDFTPLAEGGPWVLSRRCIETESFEGDDGSRIEFVFSSLKSYD